MMEDIVFKPKYGMKFRLLIALLLIIAASVLAAGIIMLLAALQGRLSPEEAAVAAGFYAPGYFIMFVLIVLCSLNITIRKIVIGSGGMSVATLLGTVKRRPFAPKAYYEQGSFIINGFVISGGFFKNTAELDSKLKKLSAEGKIRYRREKEVFASRPMGFSFMLSIAACVLGIVLSLFLGLLGAWAYIIAIDAVFLVWFILTFNKLPRAGKGILKQLSIYFE